MLLALNSGIPASPFILGSQNPNGTLILADETIWQSSGKLYATYDAWVLDLTSFTVVSIVVVPELYQIDPTTGLATVIGPTALGIGAVVDVNGTGYAFDDFTNQTLTLDLANEARLSWAILTLLLERFKERHPFLSPLH